MKGGNKLRDNDFMDPADWLRSKTGEPHPENCTHPNGFDRMIPLGFPVGAGIRYCGACGMSEDLTALRDPGTENA